MAATTSHCLLGRKAKKKEKKSNTTETMNKK
jgi:hypothetical protein